MKNLLLGLFFISFLGIGCGRALDTVPASDVRQFVLFGHCEALDSCSEEHYSAEQYDANSEAIQTSLRAQCASRGTFRESEKCSRTGVMGYCSYTDPDSSKTTLIYFKNTRTPIDAQAECSTYPSSHYTTL